MLINLNLEYFASCFISMHRSVEFNFYVWQNILRGIILYLQTNKTKNFKEIDKLVKIAESAPARSIF